MRLLKKVDEHFLLISAISPRFNGPLICSDEPTFSVQHLAVLSPCNRFATYNSTTRNVAAFPFEFIGLCCITLEPTESIPKLPLQLTVGFKSRAEIHILARRLSVFGRNLRNFYSGKGVRDFA